MDDDFDPTACKNCGSPLDEDEREVCGPCYAEEMHALAVDEMYAEEGYRQMCESGGPTDPHPDCPF